MKLTVRPDLAEPLFVYYALSTTEARERIIRESTASGVPKINVAYLRDFEIQLPSLATQRAIASLLDALDDKVELNRRMNRALEGLASALYKSWFVDFDPVQAKREGREAVGVAAPLLPLVPEHFVDSELGPIPNGWRATRVGEEFRLAMGQSPPGSEQRLGASFAAGT
jgi:type I restriction enzyme S subunit